MATLAMENYGHIEVRHVLHGTASDTGVAQNQRSWCLTHKAAVNNSNAPAW
jgi:hypothetical protein